MSSSNHIAILGTGPTGIEAALAATDAGLSFTLYEAGERVAEAIQQWGHVRLFSPWDLDVSPRMRRHLQAAGLDCPLGDACPKGAELVEQVLKPLCRLPSIAPYLRLSSRVVAIGRRGLLKHEEICSEERGGRPFQLLVRDAQGKETAEQAARVLDCSGTWGQPNQLGDGGIPALGETAHGAAIGRHVPDIAGVPEEWAGRTILLIGAGYSAQTAARELAAVAEKHPATQLIWALRSAPSFPVEDDDPLPERAALSRAAAALTQDHHPAVKVLAPVVVEAITRPDQRFSVTLRRASGESLEVVADRVLALTGYAPDASIYRQLQVHECYATSGPIKLAAALLGSGGGGCLAQTSHGVESLLNPEPGFFILGNKSYGRNTTFLMRTGWQQVEEVFAYLLSEVENTVTHTA